MSEKQAKRLYNLSSVSKAYRVDYTRLKSMRDLKDPLFPSPVYVKGETRHGIPYGLYVLEDFEQLLGRPPQVDVPPAVETGRPEVSTETPVHVRFLKGDFDPEMRKKLRDMANKHTACKKSLGKVSIRGEWG